MRGSGPSGAVMKHRIVVEQVFKAYRTIYMEIESDATTENVVEEVASGSIDIPEFDDPAWKTAWDLQSERVESADGEWLADRREL